MVPYTESQTQSSPSKSSEIPAPSRPKCEGKDALCKAMGALFLQHRVETLESDVEKLQYKRDTRVRGTKGKGCPFGREGGREVGGSRGIGRDGLGSEDLSRLPAISRKSQPVERVIVADASLLIYSLRTVHEWIKAGNCHIVVPIEALSTLDVLKKGEHHINMAARKAMRFLDERCTRDALAPEDNDIFSKHSVAQPGLFAQREGQKLKPEEVEGLRMWLLDSNMMAPVDMHEGHLAWSFRKIPNYIRETLLCALWFLRSHINAVVRDGDALAPSFSLALALPPPHLDGFEDSAPSSNLRYAERADGRQIAHWAKTCCQDVHASSSSASEKGDWIIVAPTASSWLSAPCSVANVKGEQATSMMVSARPSEKIEQRY